MFAPIRWGRSGDRTVAKIDTRTARGGLTHRKAPYWHVLERGLAIGYHRPQSGAGAWWVRALIEGKHRMAALGTADDAEGVGMNWSQAQAKAREWRAQGKPKHKEPLTVAMTVERYVAHLRAHKGEHTARETAGRLRKHFLPVFGDRLLADLTADDLRTWLNRLVVDGDEDERRRSQDTANRLLAMVKAACNLAFENGKVTNDQAWRRVKAFKAVGEARKVILSESEIQRLVDACPSGLRELVAARGRSPDAAWAS
jgi:hypothetical protein